MVNEFLQLKNYLPVINRGIAAMIKSVAKTTQPSFAEDILKLCFVLIIIISRKNSARFVLKQSNRIKNNNFEQLNCLHQIIIFNYHIIELFQVPSI